MIRNKNTKNLDDVCTRTHIMFANKAYDQKASLKERGITLIALVVTIIILLILAGVAINSITGDNGLINKTKQAVSKYKEAEQDEKRILDDMTQILSKDSQIKYINSVIDTIQSTIYELWDTDGTYRDCQDILQHCEELSVRRDVDEDLTDDDIMKLQTEMNKSYAELVDALPNSKQIKIEGLENEGFGDISIKVLEHNDLSEDGNELVLKILTKEENTQTHDNIEKAYNKLAYERSNIGGLSNSLSYHMEYYERYIDVLNENTSQSEIDARLANNAIDVTILLVSRIRELTQLYIVSDESEAKFFVQEMSWEIEEINRLLTNAKNQNGVKLLNGEWRNDINMTLDSLGISNFVQRLQENSEAALEAITNATTIVNNEKSKI